MMSEQAISIIGAGAITSLGLSLATIMPALRAKLDNFQDTQFTDQNNKPVIGSKVKIHNLGDDTPITSDDKPDTITVGLEDQYQWACMAIDEALSYINLQDYQEYCLIFTSANTDQPNLIDYEAFYEKVVEYCQSIIGEESLYHLHLPFGETAPATALLESQGWLYESNKPKRAVIIVGADSWLALDRMQHGLTSKRILSDSQTEGCIPSEAASALILTQKTSSNSSIDVLSAAIEEEPLPLSSEKNSTSDGLTFATKKALELSNIQVHEIELLLTDLAGEDYFFSEVALVWGRILRTTMPKHSEKHYVLNYLGHLGSVNGVFLLAYAWALNLRGQHPGKNTLIQLTSEDSSRAAIVAIAN